MLLLLKELTKELTNKYKEGIAWGEAKELLFELLEEKISPLRKNYEALIDDRTGLEKNITVRGRKGA